MNTQSLMQKLIGLSESIEAPGIYKHTGERIAPMQESYECREPLRLHWVTTEEDYENIWADGKS